MFLRHSLLCRLFVSSQEEHTREHSVREWVMIERREIAGEHSALISMPLMFCSFLSTLNSLLFWNDFTWKFFERKILCVPYIFIHTYVFWLEVNTVDKSLFSLHINLRTQSVNNINKINYFFSAVQIIIQNLICCARYIWLNYWKCKCQKQKGKKRGARINIVIKQHNKIKKKTKRRVEINEYFTKYNNNTTNYQKERKELNSTKNLYVK